MGRPATDKKQRLIQAAVSRFHRNGYSNTSLADLATDTGISPGNTYYYFKAKSDLAKAVIDSWCETLQDDCRHLSHRKRPKESILAFISSSRSYVSIYLALGCPLATLARDLSRESPELREYIKRIYAVYYSWLEAKFSEMGFSDNEALAHSRFLMAGMQGAISLSHAQQDGSLVTDEINALSKWLKSLRPKNSATAQ